ncbi:MAG: heparinase II/III-family protein, partial [Nitrospirota bacterium]|nr:heparinase II/III-family protein [Nitrospirota bacterium]
TLGAIFFKESKFKVREFGFSEEALWVFGEKGYGLWQGQEENALENLTSRSFSDAGWHVMRNNRDYLLVSCGPNGQKGNGGHAHNDKLSFELCLDGEDIIIDPGTYVYTPEPDMRNLFRSTAYHNTVLIEGMEQNRIPCGYSGLFSLVDDAGAGAMAWDCTGDNVSFMGEHRGFHAKGITHKREISFQKGDGTIRIKDRLQGPRASSGVAIFHLHPDRKTARTGESIMLSDKIHVQFHGSDGITLSEYFYSHQYGNKERSQAIKVIFHGELITDIRRIHG